MHELSIADGLVRLALEHAHAHGATRVTRIDLELGALAAVERRALEQCFPFATHGTVCEDAELRIALVAARGSCPGCGASADVTDLFQACADCGRWPLDTTGGRDIRLASLEVM